MNPVEKLSHIDYKNLSDFEILYQIKNILVFNSELQECYRRCYLAVLVSKDRLYVTAGWNHCPSSVSCIMRNCLREELNIPRGTQYEICRSVHAEQHVLIDSTPADLFDATLYLVGVDYKTKELVSNVEPCIICKRMLMHSRLDRVVTLGKEGITSHKIEDWIRSDVTSIMEDTYKKDGDSNS